jgi:hypothetical protein
VIVAKLVLDTSQNAKRIWSACGIKSGAQSG